MTYQERISDCDTRVHPSAWEFLVKHWSSETGQGAIIKIAPIYPDIAQKEESRDDLLVKVLGEDRRGHVCCFGLVPTPCLWIKPNSCRMLRILSKTKNAAKEEKHRMQQEIANLKQKYEDVQREMSMIRAMFESTEKMPQDLHKPEKRIVMKYLHLRWRLFVTTGTGLTGSYEDSSRGSTRGANPQVDDLCGRSLIEPCGRSTAAPTARGARGNGGVRDKRKKRAVGGAGGRSNAKKPPRYRR
uniref:Uncharacterized protein n=1 Tax=Ananas comosus var. bracteatus TaxID=296719 RepID=A0A6V7Q025_ANACO|nr:unnamed protein product [Ananas comosus var. bracteatus]